MAKKGISAVKDPAEAGETLGERLRFLRREKDFSIADLAKASGVPGSTISKIENGLLNPEPGARHQPRLRA